jgi:hypothetical protein
MAVLVSCPEHAMKIAQYLSTALTLVFAVSTVQAATPPYHVAQGYYGSVTVRASGSCQFSPVSYKNAWLGNILDSTDTPVGYGFITANGELLFLEQDYAPVSYVENTDTGVGKDISYTNMVGPELFNFVQAQSGCSIWSIVPNTNSRLSIKWDTMRGKDHAQANANFSGFETEVCQVRQTGKQCVAHRFSGSVTFKGDWSTPG